MSTETPSTSPTESASQQRSTRYLVGAGLLLAVLGVVAMLVPLLSGVGLSIALGAVLVVGGLTHFVQAFRVRGWAGSLWQVVLAVLYALAGVSLIANPVLGLATLTLLLVAYLAVAGLVELVIGVKLRPDAQWGWFVASGVVSLVLAGLIWVGFPSTAAWALGLLVGVHLLTTGLALVFAGYLGRPESTTSGKDATEGSPRSG
jgi:uncharacterized membrane protein HdeD (DUF308 family)